MLIHVGYPKTGSTWLQEDLFVDRAAGFCAPWLVEAKFELLLANPYRFDAARLRAKFQPQIDAAERDGLTPVLSDEWLIGNQMTADYRGKQAAEQLHAAFPDAQVLIVIREQVAMLLSSYREYVACYGGAPLDEFVGENAKVAGFAAHCRLDHFEFDLAIEHYDALFGRERVLVEPFERMVKDPSDFHRRLCAWTGARGEYSKPKAASNVGLRGVTLQRRRALNNFVQPFGFQFRRGESRRRWIESSASLLGKLASKSAHERAESELKEQARKLVGDRYVESNRRVASRLGVDLAQLGYRV